jgi:hypothetical protein
MTALTERAATRHRTVWKRVVIGTLIVWGVMHVVGGFSVVATSGQAAFEAVATAASPADLPANPSPVVEDILNFLMFLIGMAGVAVTVAAVTTLRARWPVGIVPVMLVIGLSDLALIMYMLIPGHMSPTDGIWGPLLFVIALLGYGAARRDLPPAHT